MPPSDEPLTPLAEGMAGMHEMFVSLLTGGFTEQQAIALVAHWLYLTTSGGGNGGG